MSYYYNNNFTSPEPIYALVREELKSYFQTGAVDDLLFPTYVDKCLSKLGRSTYKIEPAILYIDDFKAELPPDFIAIREAWGCTPIYSATIRDPGAVYQQVTVNIDEFPARSCNIDCTGVPEVITVTYKTQGSQTYTYRKSYLLKPGNVAKDPECRLACANYGSSSIDSFDVRGNKFFTNFRCGNVYILYYSQETDENDNQLIPDLPKVKQYIEDYLKYKVFEQLSNIVTDETFNQIQQKLGSYEQKANESFIIAQTELKKETPYDKQRAAIRTRNRFNRFKISNGGTTRQY